MSRASVRFHHCIPVSLVLATILLCLIPASSVFALSVDNRGGDDTSVDSGIEPAETDLAIADNGDIYVAVSNFFAVGGMQIRVYRSQDGGSHFSLWGTLENIYPEIRYTQPSIVVAGGTCFLACTRSNFGLQPESIVLVASPTAGTSATWGSELEVLAGKDQTRYSHPDLACDAVGYQDFHLYLVAKSTGDTSDRIWYTRSTDGGATFETPYALAKYDSSTRSLLTPLAVRTGFGGNVHVAWTVAASDTIRDNTVVYRRCPNRGAGGLAAWDAEIVMATDVNGISEGNAVLAASPFDGNIQLCYLRRTWDQSSLTYTLLGLGIRYSADAGANWTGEVTSSDALDALFDMSWGSNGLRFMVAGRSGDTPAFQEADADDPYSWDAPMSFADQLYSGNGWARTGLASDPSHGGRFAQAWLLLPGDGSPKQVIFDAEWRGDPGYPNLEPGFPVTLDAEPLCDPTVADLDGDGFLEIVFTDTANRINVYRHDGTPWPGWPLATGTPLTRGPVAIGDLNGDGKIGIFCGTADGRILAFNILDGVMHPFPVTLSPADSVFLSIGALGGPYPRTLIATVGNTLAFLDHRGQTPPGAQSWIFPLDDLHQPAASGDIDGDGVAEVVVTGNTSVTALRLHDSSILWTRDLGRVVSGAPTLTDMDLDGDMEIAVPTTDGYLFLLDDQGLDLPGFPIDTGTGSPLSSVACAPLVGTSEPELVTDSRNGMVLAYDHNGLAVMGFPLTPDPGFPLPAMPAVANLDTGNNEVLSGSDSGNIWAWHASTTVVDGWPRALAGEVAFTPAFGDLDQDSLIEGVFLTRQDPTLVALGFQSASLNPPWPMFGHDPRNTGCYGCIEDVVTGVDEDPSAALPSTRVRFAPPSPNPGNGRTVFGFTLPSRAAVRLEIFDARGKRVRTVVKEELPAGEHTAFWDGLDRKGRRPASGVYHARLRLRGPGLDRELTRKIVRLR